MDNNLKQMFCKDYNIPIKVFSEPVFSSRIHLYENLFKAQTAWTEFTKHMETVDQSIYKDNRFKLIETIKDDIINRPEYISWNTSQIPKFENQYSKTQIYNDKFVDKHFISIDMKSANFNVFRLNNIIKEKTYEEFIRNYTDDMFTANSKYFRQVLFGNLNPSRNQTWQKIYMIHIVNLLQQNIEFDVICLNNDEIVIDISNTKYNKINFIESINSIPKLQFTPLNVTEFYLKKINGTKGFYKKFTDDTIKIYNVPPHLMPFVARKFNDEPYQDNDYIFIYEHELARLLTIPDITL